MSVVMNLLYDLDTCRESTWHAALFNFSVVVIPLGWIASTELAARAFPTGTIVWVMLYIVSVQLCTQFLCMHPSPAFILPALGLWVGSLVWNYISRPWPRLIKRQREAQEGDLNNVYAATTQAQLDAVLTTHARALIMFHDGWEAPAQEIDPLFSWLADQYSAPGFFAFVRVDLGFAPAASVIAARYRVRASLPHFAVVENRTISDPIPQAAFGTGEDRYYTTGETRLLMEEVKRLSDEAWAAAHAAALGAAEASSARVYFHYLNGARARTHAYTDRPVVDRVNARKASMRIAYEPKVEARFLGEAEEVGDEYDGYEGYSPDGYGRDE